MNRHSFFLSLLVFLFAWLPLNEAAQITQGDDQLFVAYLKLSLAQQIPKHIERIKSQSPETYHAEMEQVTQNWTAQEIRLIRTELQDHFQNEARSRFQDFVAGYTTAESHKDENYLQNLSGTLQLDPAPDDYADLRRQTIDIRLQTELARSSEFLSRVDTWIEAQQKNLKMPALSAWVVRKPRSPETRSSQAATPVDPLRAMEASSTNVSATGVPRIENPMDSYSKMQDAEREKRLKESKEGMKQLASERRAYEEDYAREKLAEAKKEAEAIRQQSEQMAAVEAEALNQRQNSFSGKLKRIVGTAVGAVGGGIMGGVGARAGQELANEIFPVE